MRSALRFGVRCSGRTGCGGAPPDLDHRIAVRVRKAQRVMAGGESRAGRPPVIADEIVGNARAIHQGTGTLSEAMISAPSAGDQPSTPRPRRNRARAGLASGPGPIETDLSASRKFTHPVPGPRPASEP